MMKIIFYLLLLIVWVSSKGGVGAKGSTRSSYNNNKRLRGGAASSSGGKQYHVNGDYDQEINSASNSIGDEFEAATSPAATDSDSGNDNAEYNKELVIKNYSDVSSSAEDRRVLGATAKKGAKNLKSCISTCEKRYKICLKRRKCHTKAKGKPRAVCTSQCTNNLFRCRNDCHCAYCKRFCYKATKKCVMSTKGNRKWYKNLPEVILANCHRKNWKQTKKCFKKCSCKSSNPAVFNTPAGGSKPKPDSDSSQAQVQGKY